MTRLIEREINTQPEEREAVITIENVSNFKYLGHIIERNLSDSKDIERVLNQFYAKFNSTFRNFKNVSI
ncbi:MAG: hypothetical protein AAFR37_13965, partial [Cyanobacteria bacterium J06628_3]